MLYFPPWANFKSLTLSNPQKLHSFVLFLKPLARTPVTPKPRQDDPLSGLVGKRHSTGGQRSQGSPCCVRVSGGLMNPDRIATEAESLQSYIWIIWLDNETESSLLEGVYVEKKNISEIFEQCPDPRIDNLWSLFTHMAAVFGVDSTSFREL